MWQALGTDELRQKRRKGGSQQPLGQRHQDNDTATCHLFARVPRISPWEKKEGGVNMDSHWCMCAITVETEADEPVLSTFQKQRDRQD